MDTQNQPSTLKPWLGAILSKFVAGMAHGALLGNFIGAGQTIVTQVAPDQRTLIWTNVLGIFGNAFKEVFLYVQSNPLPNLLAAPVIAPIPGPVAPPTVSDQPSTLMQPTATPNP